MSASDALMLRVKNTFIEASITRAEGKRRATCPTNWKAPDLDEGDSEAEQQVDTVATIHEEHSAFESEGLHARGISGGSTQSTHVGSPRSRCGSGSSTVTVDSQESGEKDEHDVPTAAMPWWRGRVWVLARDRNGCRQLQVALESKVSEAEKLMLLAELRGHIHEAARCPHANYVLQKCITSCETRHLEFVVQEIVKDARAVAMVARHKYGCRIIQRLLEHCTHSQVQHLADNLLAKPVVIDTCAHAFGNFAMQHLYEHGTVLHRHTLVMLLVENIELTTDTYFCTVVGKILSCGDRHDREALAKAIYSVHGLLAHIAQSRAGQFTARLARQVMSAS